MRVAKELLSAFVVLTALYLALVHFTGFSRDVGALGSAGAGLFKVAQGR